MKINELKQIVKEAVKEAVREVLLEEVQTSKQTKQLNPSINHIIPEYNSTRANNSGGLASIFEDTRRGMSSQEARNFLGEVGMSSFETPVVESQPDFIKNAAAIFKKTLEKSSNSRA